MRATGFLALLSAGVLLAAEGSFERTLKVNGPVDLDVKSGAGSVTVRAGSAGGVRVYGKIRVHSRRLSESEAQDRVRRLEANPPVEQAGNVIRIGEIEDRELRKHTSISFEITTPPDTRLKAHTGSGSQTIDGIAGPVDAGTGSGNLILSAIGDRVTASTGSGSIELRDIKGIVRANTGSGAIRADAIAGAFRGSSGSGSIRVSQTASGDVDIGTGSGSIEITAARAGLRAHSGSGSISIDGDPKGPWKLDVASGNIRARLPAEASFDLRASTGSGSISIDHPLTVQGQIGRRHVQGRVRSGRRPGRPQYGLRQHHDTIISV